MQMKDLNEILNDRLYLLDGKEIEKSKRVQCGGARNRLPRRYEINRQEANSVVDFDDYDMAWM